MKGFQRAAYFPDYGHDFEAIGEIKEKIDPRSG
jgi:hypothetical protein